MAVFFLCSFLNSGCSTSDVTSPQGQSIDSLFTEADLLYENEDFSLAAEKYEMITIHEPDTAFVWDRLARSRYYLSQYPEAIEAFKKAAELGYRTTSNLYNVSISYGKIGDVNQGLNWIEKAIDAGFSNKYGLLINDDLDVFRAEPRWQNVLSGFFKTDDYPELSQPIHKISNLGITEVEMSDGIKLATEVVLPEGSGPFPVILVRTPYGKGWQVFHRSHWAARGYALVVQDVRGRGDSEGAWEPWLNERKDGYDTIDWISKQSWSNGKVGMIGASYVAQVQWLAATETHPALKAIVPLVSGTDPFLDTPYDHGIFKTALLNWAFNTTYPEEEIPQYDVSELQYLPLSKIDDAIFGKNVPLWDEWVSMEKPGDWKDAEFLSDLDKVKIPVLHVSGLWDVESIGTATNWMRLQELKHDKQWLVFGPWAHQNFVDPISTNRGDIEYGKEAAINMQELWVRWFDHWLKDKEVNWDSHPIAKVFLTGENKWVGFESWPPNPKELKSFYLNDDSQNPGFYSLKKEPGTDLGNQSYLYDPSEVPLRTNNTFSETTIFDHKTDSKDELRYATEPLETPLHVIGPNKIELFISTNVPDTDFFVFLLDIDKEGTARALGHPGKIRAKYIHGWDQPISLKADSIYKLSIPMFPVAHKFEKGHRIGVAIRSEWFPRFARNLNTNESLYDASTIQVAKQTIHYGSRYPSVLKLFVMPVDEDNIDRPSESNN